MALERGRGTFQSFWKGLVVISVNRIIRGVMIGLLLLAVALIATACGGDPEWFYVDDSGRRWEAVDSVATSEGKVPLLTTVTHEEHCAIKAAVEAIPMTDTAYPEFMLRRHNPKYFFARSWDDTIPTMCYSDLGCVDIWGDIPAWLGIDFYIDGLYSYQGGQQEIIFVRGYEISSAYPLMNFDRILYVVIHEEVHGLGSGFRHGTEMDQLVEAIYNQAFDNLSTDSECRDLLPTIRPMRYSAGHDAETRRPVD